MRTKLKNVVDGRVGSNAASTSAKSSKTCAWSVVPTSISTQTAMTTSYVNNETFEQVPINKELVTGAAFMKEGDVVEVVSDASTETVLYAEMPMKTVLKIAYTEPGIKGRHRDQHAQARHGGRPALRCACRCSSMRATPSRSIPATAVM